jgi:uncharacterized protein (TIGR00251 family)
VSASWYRLDPEHQCLVLTLHVQPNARQTEVAGLHGDALKIKVSAAAVDGQANAKLLAFLAQRFDVPLNLKTSVTRFHAHDFGAVAALKAERLRQGRI